MSDSGFDLESQTTTSSTGSGPFVPKKPVGMNFSSRVAEQFEKAYGIEPILQTGQPYHDHPHLAYQRNTLERMAIKHAEKLSDGKIGDVGSAAARVRRISDRIHCMCPQLQPGDADRLQEGRRSRASICTHRWEECNCVTFDSLIFIHSAYYFPEYATWKEQLGATTTKTAFVVGHIFDECVSFFPYDEGRYEMRMSDDGPVVFMKVSGNAHTYVHQPLLWDGGGRPGDRNSSLDVSQVARMGSTYLWRVTLVDRPPSLYDNLNNLTALVDTGHRGPTQAPGHNVFQSTGLARNDVANLTIDRLYGFGPILWTERQRIWVPIPRGAIESVALRISGRTRTPALLQDVHHWMRAAVEAARLPPRYQLAAATLGAGLAFVVNLTDEINVGQTIAYRYESWWKVHEQIYALVPATRCTTTIIVVAFVLTLLLSLSLLVILPEFHHLVGLSVLLVWSVALIMVACACCCARYNQNRTMDTWSTSLFHRFETSSINATAAPPSITAFPANPSLVEPLIPDPTVGTITVNPDRVERNHPGTANLPMRIGGIVFASPTPAVAEQSQRAELVAITNRVMVDDTEVDPESYEKYRNKDLEARRTLSKIRVHERESDFYDWVRKFPESQRTKFIEIYEEVKDTDPQPLSDNVFNKFEKDKAYTRNGPPKHKPRVVTAVADKVKVMVCPTIAKIASAVRKIWDGRRSKFLYCSGLTPDEIGSVVDDWVESRGGYDVMVGLSNDFKLYDSTLQNELLNSARQDYLAMGMSKRTLAWLNSSKSQGISTHGVRFKHGEKLVHGKKERRKILASGYPDTNLVGSKINAEAHESGLPPSLDYLMLVCGDDNFLIARRSDLTQEVVDSLLDHLRKLGLQPTPILSQRRCDWEFCSKLFWYATDKQGKTVTVLGPKPGRLLTRVGWNLSVPGAANFKGALMGLVQDCNHIPYLREFIARGLELTKGQKARLGSEYQELKHVSRAYDPHPLNMRLINERYGVTETSALEFLAALAAADRVPIVIQFSWLEDMYERDL